MTVSGSITRRGIAFGPNMAVLLLLLLFKNNSMLVNASYGECEYCDNEDCFFYEERCLCDCEKEEHWLCDDIPYGFYDKCRQRCGGHKETKAAWDAAEADESISLFQDACYDYSYVNRMYNHAWDYNETAATVHVQVRNGEAVNITGEGSVRKYSGTILGIYNSIKAQCIDPCPPDETTVFSAASSCHPDETTVLSAASSCSIKFDSNTGLPVQWYINPVRHEYLAADEEEDCVLASLDLLDCSTGEHIPEHSYYWKCNGYQDLKERWVRARTRWTAWTKENDNSYKYSVERTSQYSDSWSAAAEFEVKEGVASKLGEGDKGGTILTRTMDGWLSQVWDRCVADCPVGNEATTYGCSVDFDPQTGALLKIDFQVLYAGNVYEFGKVSPTKQQKTCTRCGGTLRFARVDMHRKTSNGSCREYCVPSMFRWFLENWGWECGACDE